MILIKISMISMGLLFSWLFLNITGVVDGTGTRNEKIFGLLAVLMLMSLVIGIASIFDY